MAHHLAGDDDDEGGGAAGRLLARLVFAAFLSMGVMVFSLSLYGEGWARSMGAGEGEGIEALRGLGMLGAGLLSVPIFLLLGVPLLEAVVRMRRWLSSEALILLGVLASLTISFWNMARGEGHVYFETASFVLVLVTLGRWLEASAKEKASAQLRALLPTRVDPVARLVGDGEESIDPGEVRPGDRIRARPGEVVPVDGVVIEGRALVDASPLTGEAEPRPVGPGDEVVAGSIPTDGSLVLEVTAVGRDRILARVDELLAESLRGRGRLARVADRFAAVLLPFVLAACAGTVAWHWSAEGPERALLAGLSVVLIACPCALGIATPLALWLAMGEAWRRGALVRGAEVLEDLARAKHIWLDKTGTLTEGELDVIAVELLAAGRELGEAGVIALAATLEEGSEHPVGRAIRRHSRKSRGACAPGHRIEEFRVLAGRGVEGRVDGRDVRLTRFDGEAGNAAGSGPTRVLLEVDGTPHAIFSLRSRPRPEAERVLAELRSLGFEPRVLTGDGPGPAALLAAELGVEVRASCSPEDKRDVVSAPGTIFVGDGWNDSPALAAASVGISVEGGVGRSLERASVNLLRPGLDALPELIRLARRASGIARWNLAWASAYNAIGLALAIQGKLTPVVAAAIMVVSSTVVVLQARRVLEARPQSGSFQKGAG